MSQSRSDIDEYRKSVLEARRLEQERREREQDAGEGALARREAQADPPDDPQGTLL